MSITPEMVATLVQGVVAKAVPEAVRDDVTQELSVLLLSGELRPSQLTQAAQKCARHFLNADHNSFKFRSLDAPVRDGGSSLHELLASEDWAE